MRRGVHAYCTLHFIYLSSKRNREESFYLYFFVVKIKQERFPRINMVQNKTSNFAILDFTMFSFKRIYSSKKTLTLSLLYKLRQKVLCPEKIRTLLSLIRGFVISTVCHSTAHCHPLYSTVHCTSL